MKKVPLSAATLAFLDNDKPKPDQADAQTKLRQLELVAADKRAKLALRGVIVPAPKMSGQSCVNVETLDANGREKTVRVLEPGDLFADIEAIDRHISELDQKLSAPLKAQTSSVSKANSSPTLTENIPAESGTPPASTASDTPALKPAAPANMNATQRCVAARAGRPVPAKQTDRKPTATERAIAARKAAK